MYERVTVTQPSLGLYRNQFYINKNLLKDLFVIQANVER